MLRYSRIPMDIHEYNYKLPFYIQKLHCIGKYYRTGQILSTRTMIKNSEIHPASANTAKPIKVSNTCPDDTITSMLDAPSNVRKDCLIKARQG